MNTLNPLFADILKASGVRMPPANLMEHPAVLYPLPDIVPLWRGTEAVMASQEAYFDALCLWIKYIEDRHGVPTLDKGPQDYGHDIWSTYQWAIAQRNETQADIMRMLARRSRIG